MDENLIRNAIENITVYHTHIKQLGFSGLRKFGSHFGIFAGWQVRSPKTQPFHIVKRKQQGQQRPFSSGSNKTCIFCS